MSYTLSLYETIKSGMPFIANVTAVMRNWKRTNHRFGWCWLGDADYWLGRDDPLGITESDAVDFFQNGLGRVLVENVGDQMTWRGLVYEMELTREGHTLKRSLDDMVNKLMWTYSRVSQNLVLNPSAETDLSNVDGLHAIGWGGLPVANITRVNTWATDGTWSFEVDTTPCSYAGGGIAFDLSENCVAGGTYRFICDVQVTASGPGGAAGVDAGVEMANDGYAKVVGTDSAVGVYHIDEVFTVPEGMSGLTRPTFRTEGSVIFRVDDVQLYVYGTRTDTPWYQDTSSQGKFGTKEEIVIEDMWHKDAAEAAAELDMTERASGRILPPESIDVDIRPISDERKPEGLHISVAGLVFTLGWKYATQVGILGASAQVSALITNDAELIAYTVGKIETNTLASHTEEDEKIRVWDALQKIIRAGDGNPDNLWWGGVGPDAKFYYGLVSSATAYEYRNGVMYYPNSERVVEPWLLRPGWIEEKFMGQTLRYYAEEIGAGADGRVVFGGIRR